MGTGSERPSGQPALVPTASSPQAVSTKGFDQAQGVDGQILQSRGCDPEVAAIMDDLSKLQTLLTLQMRHGPVWIAAADLVQRTRCLIVERCFDKAASTDIKGS
jgi:hypothetical protein